MCFQLCALKCVAEGSKLKQGPISSYSHTSSKKCPQPKSCTLQLKTYILPWSNTLFHFHFNNLSHNPCVNGSCTPLMFLWHPQNPCNTQPHGLTTRIDLPLLCSIHWEAHSKTSSSLLSTSWIHYQFISLSNYSWPLDAFRPPCTTHHYTFSDVLLSVAVSGGSYLSPFRTSSGT